KAHGARCQFILLVIFRHFYSHFLSHASIQLFLETKIKNDRSKIENFFSSAKNFSLLVQGYPLEIHEVHKSS
ncbi:MAG: hypothetical protein V7750_00005, partial [Sneathiella sp.]